MIFPFSEDQVDRKNSLAAEIPGGKVIAGMHTWLLLIIARQPC
jgi:hypothetical protein